MIFLIGTGINFGAAVYFSIVNEGATNKLPFIHSAMGWLSSGLMYLGYSGILG